MGVVQFEGHLKLLQQLDVVLLQLLVHLPCVEEFSNLSNA